ncbi:hypothetical protein [Parabacteroides johnsonii]|nr:hypothetical protein [Parabacteroides johnsonii]UEA91028.1 hypothetical protein LK449_02055 [Parabacteroides johnsonii]UWP43182.1 hypothetical protein NQ564_01020 [Parabacteroides johnsonii DSM 18315]
MSVPQPALHCKVREGRAGTTAARFVSLHAGASTCRNNTVFCAMRQSA